MAPTFESASHEPALIESTKIGLPAFVVRPVGHDDYYAYGSQVGACFANWQTMDDPRRRLQLMIDAWHIVAFYDVPVDMVKAGLLVIPEYRDMLAGDCLPREFQHEREG